MSFDYHIKILFLGWADITDVCKVYSETINVGTRHKFLITNWCDKVDIKMDFYEHDDESVFLEQLELFIDKILFLPHIENVTKLDLGGLESYFDEYEELFKTKFKYFKIIKKELKGDLK